MFLYAYIQSESISYTYCKINFIEFLFVISHLSVVLLKLVLYGLLILQRLPIQLLLLLKLSPLLTVKILHHIKLCSSVLRILQVLGHLLLLLFVLQLQLVSIKLIYLCLRHCLLTVALS